VVRTGPPLAYLLVWISSRNAPRCSTSQMIIQKCAVAACSCTRATWTRIISTRATIPRATSATSVFRPNRNIPRCGDVPAILGNYLSPYDGLPVHQTIAQFRATLQSAV
jgi:hypothetical protein